MNKSQRQLEPISALSTSGLLSEFLLVWERPSLIKSVQSNRYSLNTYSVAGPVQGWRERERGHRVPRGAHCLRGGRDGNMSKKEDLWACSQGERLPLPGLASFPSRTQTHHVHIHAAHPHMHTNNLTYATHPIHHTHSTHTPYTHHIYTPVSFSLFLSQLEGHQTSPPCISCPLTYKERPSSMKSSFQKPRCPWSPSDPQPVPSFPRECVGSLSLLLPSLSLCFVPVSFDFCPGKTDIY